MLTFVDTYDIMGNMRVKIRRIKMILRGILEVAEDVMILVVKMMVYFLLGCCLLIGLVMFGMAMFRLFMLLCLILVAIMIFKKII